MAKKCNPSKKVRKAGYDLRTSPSKKEKSEASKILTDHKKKKHLK